MKNALIIGYGSIGRLHEKILRELQIFENIYIYSSQKKNKVNWINNINTISNLNISYVIIASPTSYHYKHLKIVNKLIFNKIILVEKPLFNKKINNIKFKIQNKIFVGYDLRFHPIVQLIKQIIKKRKIWNINIFCGSYLPDWRPLRNYQFTSSALKKYGGGVLLDLSHEIDYIKWIFGDFKPDYVFNKKISDLKIETNDTLILIGKINKININMTLNYYTRKPIRQIIIDGKNISISADLMTNKIYYTINNKKKYLHFKHIKRSTTQMLMHKNILSNKNKITCTFDEGKNILNLIKDIQDWRK